MSKKYHRAIFWYIILVVNISGILFIQHLAKESLIHISNFYIPDSYTYELRVFSAIELNFSFSAYTYNIFNTFLYHLGSQSFLLFNSFLLFISIHLCYDVFRNISSQAVNFSRLAIVANPYLIIGAVGPNKETILAFICLLFWKLFFTYKSKTRILALIIIAIIPVFIRPIVSLPLLISLIIYPFIQKLEEAKKIIIIILILFFFVNSIPIGNNIISSLQDNDLTSFQTSRIYELALQLNKFSQHILLQYPAFLAKSAIILLTPVLRPLNLYQEPLPLLDIGYNLVAYLYLPFNISVLMIFLKKKPKIKLNERKISIIFIFTILSLLTVLLNATLTFRYIFPFGSFIFSLFDIQNFKMKKKILFFSTILFIILVSTSPFYFRESSFSREIIIPKFMEWL